MRKRLSPVAFVILFCIAVFASPGCDKKKDEPAALVALTAPAAPAANAGTPAAPAAPAAVPERPVDPGAPGAMLPPPSQYRRVEIPAEAQAAIDDLLAVLGSIADAAKKGTCAEVLAELRALDNADVRSRLLKTNILRTYPEEVQNAISDANQPRLLAVAYEMREFQRCEASAERDAIDAAIKAILVAVDERAPGYAHANADPVAPAAVPALDPVPSAPIAAPAPQAAPAPSVAPAPQQPAAAPAPQQPAAAPAPQQPAAAPAPQAAPIAAPQQPATAPAPDAVIPAAAVPAPAPQPAIPAQPPAEPKAADVVPTPQATRPGDTPTDTAGLF